MCKHNYINLHGVTENNLKNISLKVPKKAITIFTGVSGSGKSSIVFDTISKEAQRQLSQTFSSFIQNRLPKYSQPNALSIENLSPAMVIDQKRLGGNARSTLGTATDIYSLLRLLFSRIGEPSVGESDVFSFNSPKGMCPECQGIGRKIEPDVEKLFDKTKSLNEGAILYPTFSVGSAYWKRYVYSGLFDNDKKLNDYTEDEWHTLLFGKGGRMEIPLESGGSVHSDYEGVLVKFKRLYIQKDSSQHSEKARSQIQKFTLLKSCPTCEGTRLNSTALSSTVDKRTIADLSSMELGELLFFLKGVKNPIATPIIDGMMTRLQHLIDMGLYYLTLNRETSTLSGGESQRVKMIRHLNSSLTDMIYIFDEPSIGLHPRDVNRLNQMLQKIRDKGNTIIVVEHDRDVIEIADHIVDIGPGAGTNGGEIVYQGDYSGLYDADTLTGRYIQMEQPIKKKPRKPNGYLPIVEASKHNLKNVTVDIPSGVLTAITGVAGSGKSSLILEEFVQQHSDAIVIDQKPVSTSVRSNPATYTGIMDAIRDDFAQANKVSKSLFSFNSKGACPECHGTGFIYTDLAFLEGIRTTCEMCNGKRFKDEVLQYKLDGKSISDVLDVTVLEALQFFNGKEIRHTLQALYDVGLNYLTLGQPLSTLSGGECQRIKLASELHKKGRIYILDEPTTGLHMSDVTHLLGILNRLVDNGSSVIVIEHNMDVIKQADWVVDLGPEGGRKGGQIMFEGTPIQLTQKGESITAQYLGKDWGA